MSRGGREKTSDVPERRCIVTGDVQPKAGLVRFVLGPDGVIYPDLAEKLPGRGIWVTAEREAIDKAAAKGLFARAAKAPAKVPENLADMVEDGLAHRVVELISLVRKSGRAVVGFEKVKGWLAEGRARVLFQASDGSDRGKGKLWTPEGGRWFGCLTSSELGLAFGRDHAIHGALAAGGLTRRVIDEAARLAGMRKQDGGKPALKDTKTA
ncbi:RNA-binding protein [Sedimentimonas flavescens]|uniref:RNA-binding protein n=1 Tax=Sedimentimonas flavescens TaxID=2851012 RepID=A0ABT2ZZF5_9RHOB|nr:RNA-binding protein [Sedimentimonas flavescens]MBW0158447.1 RNA-binding protein [Sedimentimonas flavescens]MCT2541010.1 RNA-binding protein [Sedimentimonas flavescens]MCV2879131.1 RNA-binding protein [Sedimentimonas flavescens]WBL33016.1 RNA-binding protein [Sinirhodobacter sp. HNIBRBA609]